MGKYKSCSKPPTSFSRYPIIDTHINPWGSMTANRFKIEMYTKFWLHFQWLHTQKFAPQTFKHELTWDPSSTAPGFHGFLPPVPWRLDRGNLHTNQRLVGTICAWKHVEILRYIHNMLDIHINTVYIHNVIHVEILIDTVYIYNIM